SPDELAGVAHGLAAARRAMLQAQNDEASCGASGSLASASADADTDDELPAVEALGGELRRGGQIPLAPLLKCPSRYGEVLLVGLADYFLCRALQADAELSQEFVFVHLEQAEELWKDDLGAMANLIEMHAAAVAGALDGPPEAAAHVAPANPKDAELERQFQLGLQRYLVADFEGANQFFTGALRLDPQCVPLYAYRGDSYRLLGEYDRAIGDYSAALRLNPASAPVLAQRAATYRLKGELQQAIADA